MDQRLVRFREVEPLPIEYEMALCAQLLRERDRGHIGSQNPKLHGLVT